MSTTLDTDRPPTAKSTSPLRAGVAAWVGGALEYYDNYAYALATALVFGHVFFPDDGATGTVAALATFAVSYFARPVGAVLLGHDGDRVGRKAVLVIILLMMGISSFLIGLLPTYEQVGIWAPVMLVALRIVQGISVGGETAAAATLTVEAAGESRRGFFTSFTSNGIVSGFVLATLVFVPISALPQEALDTWGWRVPFLLSAVVTVAGLVIRSKLSESEAFEEHGNEDELVKIPVVEALRTHWRAILRVVVCSLAFAVDTVVKVFALALATNVYGIAYSTMLWVLLVGHVLALATQPLLGMLGDRVGRRPVFIAGNLVCAIMLPLYLASISAGDVPMMFLTGALSVAGGYACINATYPAMFAEMFSLKVRQTGMALGLQVGLIAAGLAPSIYTALTAGDPGNWVPVAVIAGAICIIASLAALTARETAHTPLLELGDRPRAERGESTTTTTEESA
ncbi:MFS transporter [Brachybacterium sp. AOP25-B2-12]|uniref:MFS transporter n=1 Tax=Brachybacterium sp. AOP25-B2-12 TaxID=3457710 RepID=UPI00403378F1